MSGPREWWIGRTADGFDKWLTRKHSDEKECRTVFISSDGKDPCVEYIAVLEQTPAARHAEDMLELLREMVHFGASEERLKLAQRLLARIEAERAEGGG